MHTLTPAEAVKLIDAQIAAANLTPAHAARARALACAQVARITGWCITEVPTPAQPPRRLLTARDEVAR